MRLIIFDCDGTLVDGQDRIVSAMRAAADRCGVAPAEPEAVRRIIGLRLNEAAAVLYPGESPSLPARLAEAYRQCFREQGLSAEPEPLFPGCRACLDRLRGDGALLAVATGKGTRGLLRVLDGHGLRAYFAGWRTADDGPSKPDPAILFDLLSELGTDAEDAAMVGDTTFDIEMGKSAGVATVGVSWGYHPGAELRRAGADAIAHRFDELPEILGNLSA